MSRAAVAAAATTAGGVLLILLWRWQDYRPLTYGTTPFADRVFLLSDGSHLQLAPGSQATVHMDPHGREVHLTRGVADFDVRHDARRVFRVAAGALRVEADSTHFSVSLTSARPVVHVSAGRARVTSAGLPAMLVRAGESAQLQAGGLRRVGSENVRQFRSTDLGSLAEAFSPDSGLRLTVLGPARNLRFAATVNLDEPQRLVELLEHMPQLQVMKNGHTVIVMMREPQDETAGPAPK